MTNIFKHAIVASVLSIALAVPGTKAQEKSPRPDPLAMIQAEHVMISTDDYDGTIEWYREKLGFKVKHEWTVPGFDGVQLAYIELNGFIVEVVETPTAYQEKKIPPNLETSLSDRGYGHMGFLSADVDAVAAELKRRGVEIVVPPTSFPDAGRRLIFIRDNNGNLIEFLTPLSAYEKKEQK